MSAYTAGECVVSLGQRWTDLIAGLAECLSEVLNTPFATARVVVPETAVGKVASQAIAQRLGISAGIEFQTPSATVREAARQASLESDLDRWLGTPLTLAINAAFEQAEGDLRALQRVRGETRPGRQIAIAARLARLMRFYLDHSPQVLAAWLDGHDVDAAGEPLAEYQLWQPAIARSAIEILEVDPLEVYRAAAEAASLDTVPTFLLGLDHITVPQRWIFEALGRGPGLRAFLPLATPSSQWAASIADSCETLKQTAAVEAPQFTVHGCHHEARQVEVLRDELCRLFSADATLEPRDVVIVCGSPSSYAPLLNEAFSDPHHPASQLRLQPLSLGKENSVLEVCHTLLRLNDDRAMASSLTDFLLSMPIAHRWGFKDPVAVRELVSQAGIRWGLDAQHRASFDVAQVRQNTWLRGIDRLLVGLTAGGADAGVGLTGAETVSATDMALVGSLAEVISRLRRTVAQLQQSGSIGDWVTRLRQALQDLVGLPHDQQGELLDVLARLAQLEQLHFGEDAWLSRAEFAQLLKESSSYRRSTAGNGNLHVVGLGELLPIDHRVVVFLGINDDVVPGRFQVPPDCIELGPVGVDFREQKLQQLLLHSRNAEQVIFITQTRSARTDAPHAEPMAIQWLLTQWDSSALRIEHPAIAATAENFQDRPSFDQAALRGAQARSRTVEPDSAAYRRRQAARRLPLGTVTPQLSLTQIHNFLVDPARAFLRSRGGITRYQPAEIADELPLHVAGLEKWKILNDLIQAWMARQHPDQVATRLAAKEELPPGQLGSAGFTLALTEAKALIGLAQTDYQVAPTTQDIDLLVETPYGSVRVIDRINVRGNAIVDVTASSSDNSLLALWLQLLALNANGAQAVARLYRPASWPHTGEASVTQLVAPPDALATLSTLVHATVLGQQRLLPIPLEPGVAFARQWASGKVVGSDWEGPLGDWRSPWPRLGLSWPLFYDDDLAELLSDPRIESDPSQDECAFKSWAVALYGPFVKGQS